MSTETKSPKIMPAAWERTDQEPVVLDVLENGAIDITNDIEALSRELCIFAGHDPDASVFPGTPETVRTNYDRAFIIPPPERLMPAWRLFQPQALAVRDLKARGLLG